MNIDGLRKLGFEPLVDFVAQDDSDGAGPYIREWMSALPQPSDAEQEAAALLPAVPQSITPLQARKALRAAGLYDAVAAFVATLTPAEQDEWEYALEVRRDNATIAAGAAALELTEQQVDDLFIAGAQL